MLPEWTLAGVPDWFPKVRGFCSQGNSSWEAVATWQTQPGLHPTMWPEQVSRPLAIFSCGNNNVPIYCKERIRSSKMTEMNVLPGAGQPLVPRQWRNRLGPRPQSSRTLQWLSFQSPFCSPAPLTKPSPTFLWAPNTTKEVNKCKLESGALQVFCF